MYGADVGTSGIALWNETRKRLGGGANKTNQLAKYFFSVALPDCPTKHVPVGANMLNGGSLTQDMSSLQVRERRGWIVFRFGVDGRLEFGIDVRTNSSTKFAHLKLFFLTTKPPSCFAGIL